MKEIIGYYKIPEYLKNAENREILNWARKILLGQEPKLEGKDLKKIKEGKLKEIFIEPRIPGTFLADGTFIQLYEYSPPIGGDLQKAEEIWQKQDEIEKWVKKENKKFNKSSMTKNPEIKILWKHGRDIVKFSEKMDITLLELYKKLVQLGGKNSYKSMKHEYCVLFYQWKPDLKDNDLVLELNWKKLAHVIMFGKSDNLIKDYVLKLSSEYPLNQLNSSQLAILLQENLKKPKLNKKYNLNEKKEILTVRKSIKKQEEIEIKKLEYIVKIIQKNL